MQVCLNVCTRRWSGPWSPTTRNFPKPYSSEGYGSLYVCTLGNNLLPTVIKKKKILLPTSDLHFTIPLATELGMS